MSKHGDSASNQVDSHTDRPTKKIQIHMKSQDGNEITFRISRKLKLIELFLDYCKKRQFDFRTVRFFHEGRRVLGKYTAAKLNLEDGDEIWCMFHQSGGSFNRYWTDY